MKTKILNLRAEGKSYREIEAILGCARSTISYYCGENQKEKYLQRQQNLRKENTLIRKVDTFLRPSISKNKDQSIKSSIEKQQYDKVRFFNDKKQPSFSYKDIIDQVGESPICYLTGRPLDLSKPKTYSFDHITPHSRGGSNTIDNLGVTCREANAAKSDMLREEFLNLCADVLTHHGYVVTKIGVRRI